MGSGAIVTEDFCSEALFLASMTSISTVLPWGHVLAGVHSNVMSSLLERVSSTSGVVFNCRSRRSRFAVLNVTVNEVTAPSG